jgi:hypothetical protein
MGISEPFIAVYFAAKRIIVDVTTCHTPGRALLIMSYIFMSVLRKLLVLGATGR